MEVVIAESCYQMLANIPMCLPSKIELALVMTSKGTCVYQLMSRS